MKRTIFLLVLEIIGSILISGCKEEMVSSGIRGFNHTKDRPIYMFTVDGSMGPDVDPESGGGAVTCCAQLPATWRPGLRVKIKWEYDRMKEEDPQLPPQSMELEIPKYGKRGGSLQVHFYDNHQVKVLVSNCFPGHPFYPMDESSLLPWKSNGTRENYLEWEKKAGETHDC
ncbi:DUF3304 domain-containing protein [Pseudoduganella violaceinigra]|uniref:DUF3304 domain-containing protein n=1 Tax=Pseudoduganella violaceinigra TaxID=246602 RepID=UPI000A01C67A|nr:DUF3304 domain-containing protein [Pseudoduganella violaceinigra]